jgi:hypothetical protein
MSNNPESKDATKLQQLAQASSAHANGPVQHVTTAPGIKSSIGGDQGQESTSVYDELVKAFEEKIANIKKEIEQQQRKNQHAPTVTGTENMHLMIENIPTIFDELMNEYRQKKLDILKDPKASPSDKESAERFAKLSTDAWGTIKEKVCNFFSEGSNKTSDKSFSNPLNGTNAANTPTKSDPSENENASSFRP